MLSCDLICEYHTYYILLEAHFEFYQTSMMKLFVKLFQRYDSNAFELKEKYQNKIIGNFLATF